MLVHFATEQSPNGAASRLGVLWPLQYIRRPFGESKTLWLWDKRAALCRHGMPCMSCMSCTALSGTDPCTRRPCTKSVHEAALRGHQKGPDVVRASDVHFPW